MKIKIPDIVNLFEILFQLPKKGKPFQLDETKYGYTKVIDLIIHLIIEYMKNGTLEESMLKLYSSKDSHTI